MTMRNLVCCFISRSNCFWSLLLFSCIAGLSGQVSFDSSFATNGRFVDAELHGAIGVAVMEQPDGKIVLVGRYLPYPDEPLIVGIFVIRLNSDGTYDDTFGTNGRVYIEKDVEKDAHITAAELQRDGKILICSLRRLELF